jgi:predicted O-linked N-acetylglucosamine transferase (SPINDLY family)/ADP-heptose:LPS heptosyltransferase
MEPQELTEQPAGATHAALKELFGRANAEHTAGRFRDAEAICRELLARDENHAGAWHLLGILALRSGETKTAAAHVARAVELAPARADCRHSLGFIMRALGRDPEAEASFRKAVALDPDFVEAHYQLGNLLRETRRPAEAEASYNRVLALSPNHHQAHNNLGAALGELERHAEAIAQFRRALELKPDYVEARSNLGNSLKIAGQPAEAEAECRRAIALAPGFAPAYLNLGLALQELGRFDEALAAYRRASAGRPDYAKAVACEGILLLLRGEFAAGWEKYEARWRIGDLPPRDFTEPQWRGEPLAGRTILLHAEQGFGDAIQFLRYVPQVAARGGAVIVEIQKPLVPLAARIPGITVVARGDPLPAFDLQCPLLSLPLAFATTLDSIPAQIPYLVAPPERVAHWRSRLGGGFKVGIAWAGSPVHRNDRNRSIPLARLAPLFEIAGPRWFSLQVGPRAADLAGRPGVIDLSAELAEFAETAAAIAALDLVITADTAVAHLAGALGKPVWVMLPFAPDWRWLLGRDDSPWYPTLRLFRQPRAGDWDGVVAAVRGALAQWVVAPTHLRRDAGTRAELETLVAAANEHHQAARYAECVAALRRVIEIDPSNASALHVLALSQHHLGEPAGAVASMRKAIALSPASAQFLSDLGIMLHGQQHYEEALEVTTRALSLDAANPIAYNSLGATLAALDRAEDAIAAYRRALALKPDYHDAWANLAIAQQMLLQLDDAADSYRRALGIKFDYVQAQCSAGMLALLRGDYINGFTQFEWRWRLKSMTPRDFKQPAWQGEPLAGKTILLHAEQGAGDTIQGLRFMPEVAARGGRLVLELPRHLARLATSLEGGGEIVTQGQTLPHFDVHCAFMSLPRVLGTTLADLPGRIPYLKADAAAVERWSRRLAGTGSGLRVGIAWAGNPAHANDRRRSIALERLAPLFDVAGVRFYSLQVGERAGDLARLAGAQAPGKVVDLAPDLRNYGETAAALAHLDLVVAVDTSIVHLAGALGRPCWVMVPFSPDWRWLLEREDSPWYPSLRLFRQPRPTDWESVIARIAGELAALAVARRPPAGPPLDADALCAEAMELRTADRTADAEAVWRRILASEPDHLATLRLAGVMCEEAGDHSAAADLLARAIELAPDHAETHNNFGIVLTGLGRDAEAAAHYQRAIAIEPRNAKAHSNLGNAMRACGRFAEAEQACRRALTLEPNSAIARNNLGIALTDQGRLAEAAKSFRWAIALKPDFPEAHFNLGKALQAQGRYDEALTQFRRAIGLRADYADAQLAEAFLLLMTGDFVHGLDKLEWRWRLRDKVTRGFAQPLWRGEPLDGRTILLHAEQGFGDVLMLLRYAPLVAERGGRVIIEVPPALERLTGRLVGGPFPIVVTGTPLPAFDIHCPLMSLPLAFGTTLDTIPAAIPYLRASPEALARWHRRLADVKGMKVGIVWAGSPLHKNDRARSIGLEPFAALLDIPGVSWHSLQVGERARDLARLPAGPAKDAVTDLADGLTDFAETAAAITNLDLVISIDTAVAHLAGALGKPVWIMLPFDPDWRWLLGRGDSPWYPAARLVRQDAPGDWGGVVAKIRTALTGALDAARRAGVPTEARGRTMLDHRYFAAAELIDAHRDAEAEVELKSILAEDPQHAAALRRLAWLCHRRGDNAEAARLLTRSLEREPEHAEAFYNLGLVLSALGRNAEAEGSYRRGLALKPGSVDGHNNLGVLLEQVGRYDEAEACYRTAIDLAPGQAHPVNNLGVLLKESGRLSESLAAHRRAIAIAPDLPAAHSNLLYTLNYDESVTPQALFDAHATWGREQGGRFATDGARFANAPAPARRLRVGYVSGDFRHHSVAFFLEPLLENHDKRAVEVFLYANDVRSDAVTRRLNALADHVVPIHGLPDERAAARMREDGIDILVDLAGHTSGSRMMLFARKPSPVQVTWLGYPATTGLKAIDCRLTDAVADPPGEADRLHVERLVRLAHGFLCYRPAESAGAVAPLPARGAGHVTFGSFNNYAKLSPATVALWARIMREVPNARLLLKATQFKNEGTRERCRAAFVAAGVAADRIELVPPLAETAEHLALYGRVDIALDPLAYNGTTTTCEALWMGVPVVTLRGDRHAARVGASIMTTIGLDTLIAPTPDDYVATAVRLAGDLDGLAALRAGLRERVRASALCDAAAFARAIEAAFRTMWGEWCGAQRAMPDAALAATPRADDAAALAAAEAAAKRLFDNGRHAEAEESLRALVARAPERAQPWFLLGRVRHARGDLDAAIDFLRKAIALDPKLTAAHSDLGIFLQGQGRLDEAEACYRRALTLDPLFVNAMSNLGAVLAERGRLEEASTWYSRAIAERSDFADAHNNLGAALAKLDRAAEAETLHRRAIALKPDFADAHYNLGVVLHDQGRFDDAFASYREAVRLKPDMVDARWNRAFLLLLMGDFAEGWREHEWRWKRKHQPPRSFPQPQWRGEAPAGRTILLHAEQGIGDTLQFVRYAPLVAAQGARVVLMVQPPLKRLIAASFGDKVTVIADGEMIPPFDLHSPFLSLPLACGTTIERIPADVPYLAVDAAAAARWRERIGTEGGRRIGLVWAGNPQHKNDRNRSVALEQLAPLFDAPATRWFSLQVGERSGDLGRLAPGTVVDLADGLTDFAETAAAIAGLDLVITADTAAVHLAGALGKPVWVMVPFVPDWRWLLGRDDSPWYPTARLFRQPARRDWDSVARTMRRALDEVAGAAP